MARRRDVPAKLVRPGTEGALSRERLFSRLDQATRCPAVWVSGPAGSGKTTLVSSYIESRRIPCVWYQVDSGDEDLATFFYYLGLAGQAAPCKKKPLPLLTPGYLPAFALFSRNFFEELCARLPASSVLVLDNFQEVSENALIHRALLEGLSRLRPGMRLFLVSRESPLAAYIRHCAHRKIMVVGGDDLRFTLDETEHIARMKGFVGRLTDALPLLHMRTDGWAAGLQILLEAHRIEKNGIRLPEVPPSQEIFDYLGQEVFDRQEARFRDFLLRSSFLPGMSSATAHAITENPDAERILNFLCRRNLFTTRRAQALPIYQYHPLFREFLQERAIALLSEDEVRDIRIRAATLLKEAREMEQAVDLLREAEEWGALAEIVLESAPILFSQGRTKTLEGWIAALPPTRLETTPWLIFWLGNCRLSLYPVEARGHFERAYGLFLESSDPAGAYSAWAAVIETYFFEWNGFAPLDRWIDESSSLRARWPEVPSKVIEDRVVFAMFCALWCRRPQDPGTALWAKRVEEICLGPGEANTRLMIGAHLMRHQIWLGDHGKARWLLASLESCSKQPCIAPLTRIGWHVAEAICAWVHNDLPRCQRAVEEGAEVARSSGVHVLDGMLCAQLVLGSLTEGDLARGEASLKKLASVIDPRRINEVCQYQGLVAWLSFLQDDLNGAVRHAQTAVDAARAAGTRFSEASNCVLLGQLLAEAGKVEQAGQLLDRAEEFGRAMGSKHLVFLSLLGQARLAFNSGDRSGGLVSLGEALTLGRSQGYTVVPWSKPAILSQLCVAALEAGIETDYVKRFIKKRRLHPGAEMIHREDWPRPIKVYTLGRFGIVQDEEPLRFSGKVQQRPLSMLKAIIAFGGRNVREEQLIDALWPEADGDVAHISLRTTLHRLRRLLGSDDALLLSEGRISIDRCHCWVDAWGFQRIAGEAVNLWKKERGDRSACTAADGRVGEAIALSEKAVGLYQGDFLAGDSRHPWVLPLRERLKGKFVRLISRLGACYEQSAQWDKAMECYHRALEADDLQEEFYRRIMWCYQSAGRRAEALVTYERCRDLLSSSLGIEPSRRTVDAARIIKEYN